MVEHQSPYPAYKPSGVEWLGDVPAHWETRRLKSLAYNVSDQMTDHPNGICYVALEHVESWTGRIANEGAEAGEGQLKRFESGDVLFGKLRPYLAKVVYAKSTGLCVGEFFVLRVRVGLSPRFLEYVLRSKAAIDWINSSTFGARMPRTDWAFVGDMRFPLPPLPEQVAIARFLDHATNRIDYYIRAKEKLIALLEEQKQAVIHEAVTGRIDVRTGLPYPNQKRELSPFVDVPECWEVRRLKTIARIRYGLGQPPREVPDGLPMLRATNICRGEIVEKDMVYVDPKEVPIGRNALLAQEEILVVRSGAYTADSAIVPQEYSGAVAGYDLVVAATGVSPRFLAFALLAGYVRDDQLIVASLRAAQPHLNAEELGVALVLLPSWQDQVAIAEYLDTVTRQIQTTITHGRRQIEFLGEYRNRLIADVVSGKIDVREVAAALPDEGPFAYKGTLDEVRRFHKKQG